MRKNIAVIPKKTKVQIMGCSYELIDSVRVKGKQKYLNQALKAQTDFYNGVGIVSESPEKTGYAWSNRYKLQQAIKKTGFHAEKLSLASNHAKTYFTGFTAESRFNSRGDITEERLNSLLTTLAFAERELLGVGAKTVDDTIPKADLGSVFFFGDVGYMKTPCSGEVFNPDEKKALDNINHVCFDPDWKALQHWEKRNEPVEEETYYDNTAKLLKTFRSADEYFSNSSNWKAEENDLNKEKSDSLKSVLIAFLVVVAILAIYFFTR